MYRLTNTNLTGLGGPMGTERTSTRWTKFFRSRSGAKEYAEGDYQKNGHDLDWKWQQVGDNLTSGDQGWVMYDIEYVYTED